MFDGEEAVGISWRDTVANINTFKPTIHLTHKGDNYRRRPPSTLTPGYILVYEPCLTSGYTPSTSG